jgi:hypothetical protein
VPYGQTNEYLGVLKKEEQQQKNYPRIKISRNKVIKFDILEIQCFDQVLNSA